MDEVETEMNGEGRILVRPSGTEPLVRVMVEAQLMKMRNVLQRIADEVQSKMGLE